MIQNILKNIKVVMLDINIWTGRKTLTENDLGLTAGKELPPASLATLGSKLVMDPIELQEFQNMKTQAVRAVLSAGTRFLGGFAIPNEKIDGLMASLKEIQQKFEDRKQSFLSERYESALKKWIEANPGWEKIIKGSVVAPQEVSKRINFKVQVFDINPVDGQEEGLKTEVHGLAGQLRREIEVMAQTTWKQSFLGKKEVSQKAMRPIKAMLEKIDGLTFLEPSLLDLVQGMQDIMSGIPKKGYIKGQNFAAACGILSVLGNIPEASNLQIPEIEAEEVEETEAVMANISLPFEKPIVPAQEKMSDVWF